MLLLSKSKGHKSNAVTLETIFKFIRTYSNTGLLYHTLPWLTLYNSYSRVTFISDQSLVHTRNMPIGWHYSLIQKNGYTFATVYSSKCVTVFEY